MSLRISSKGWVVIPADLRRKYRLEPGDEVQIVDYGGVLSLIPIFGDPVAKGVGLLSGDRSLTGALLTEREKERKRDK